MCVAHANMAEQVMATRAIKHEFDATSSGICKDCVTMSTP
jgi:hypothetical protein